MTTKQKKVLYRIIAAGVLLIAAALLPFEERSIPRLIAFLVPYGIIGWDVLWKAVRNISHGQVFDENFLMCVATIGALFVGEYPEAAAVMLFYQIGELFQGVAVGRSRQSISDLMNICPEYANIERDGQIEEVDPAEVETDSIIVIKPGERIPLDGIVTEGTSNIDTAALTGESLPRSVKVGDEVIRFVADVIKSKTGETGFAGRFGGDEFVLCISDPEQVENVEVLSMDIIDDLYAGYNSPSVKTTLNIKASIGIAIYPDHSTDGKELVGCADAAMYFVKKNGKANYHIFVPEDNQLEGNHSYSL